MLPVVLVYVLLFQFSSEASVKDIEFAEHMKRVREFTCKQPRPTSVRTLDLLTVGVLAKIYIPEVTVLYQCDAGAGCCFGSKLVCGPIKSETISLKFFVTNNFDNTRALESVQVTNHTRCGCVESEEHPRRVLSGGHSKGNQCDRLSLVKTLFIIGAVLWILS